MKNIILLILISCFACKEAKKEDPSDPEKITESIPTKICFLSTGPKIQRGNKMLQDSTILNLE